MKAQTLLDKFLNWIFKCRPNCKKGKHCWVYTLSESGVVYLDESKVPPELWHCSECKNKKLP